MRPPWQAQVVTVGTVTFTHRDSVLTDASVLDYLLCPCMLCVSRKSRARYVVYMHLGPPSHKMKTCTRLQESCTFINRKAGAVHTVFAFTFLPYTSVARRTARA